MNKLSQFFKNIWEKWKQLSKGRKIGFSVLIIGIIASLLYLSIYLGTTKYAVLFSNMDSTDAGNVTTQLTKDKISYKVSGNNILVPKDQVDEVRLKMASEVQMTDGSKGFELLDTSKFGATDAEMKVLYQRALEGELERTIKSFSEVSGARVHLVIPEDSAFVQDTTKATASVTVMLKDGNTLSADQVKAIVALVSGAVKNLPKENIQVIDNKMNLLTKGLFDNDSSDSLTSSDKQQDIKNKYEKTLETKAMNMLSPIYGDKVRVNVNADLNFDAIQQNDVTYSPKGTVVSEHIINQISKDGTTTTSQSPVDNNMTNQALTTPVTGATSQSGERTTNYEISKKENKVVKAPGWVNRITASVVVDGSNMDANTRAAIQNTVSSAIGIDTKRGDTVSVEAMKFDTTATDTAKKDLSAMQQAATQKKQMIMYGIIAGVALILITGIILFIMKRRKRKPMLDEEIGENIDTLIGEEIKPKEQTKFDPIQFDVENESSHIEKEIKKYAEEKPDQVADIIKSWLSDDER